MTLFSKPKYSTVSVKKKEIPRGLWTKCPKSGEIVYNKELEQNWMVVPKSGYHFPLSAPKRVESLIDGGTFQEYDADLISVDPLKFTGVSSYPEKIEQYKLRAIGERNKAGLESEHRRRVSSELNAVLHDKRNELERLTFYYESLEKVEREQKAIIDRLRENET